MNAFVYIFLFSLLGKTPALAAVDSVSIRLCDKKTIDECPCPAGSVAITTDFSLLDFGKSLAVIPYRCILQVRTDEAAIQQASKLNEVLRDSTNAPSVCAIQSNLPQATPKLQAESIECQALAHAACLTSNFPKDCGYDHDWKNFDAKAYQKTIDTLLATDKVLCGKPYVSMCTSATFLFFLKQAQIWANEGKITKATLKKWQTLPNEAWQMINTQARPDLLVQSLTFNDGSKIGRTKTLHKNDLPDPAWPIPGDLVQIWRESMSGHSVVFQGYLRDTTGKAIGICYWASSGSTNGYGRKCEQLGKVKMLIAARMEP